MKSSVSGEQTDLARIRSEKELRTIPGVGKSIANDLWCLGIFRVSDLEGQDAQKLYERSNQIAGVIQDRCLLYVFRCAIYFAETANPDPVKLQWWWWKEKGK